MYKRVSADKRHRASIVLVVCAAFIFAISLSGCDLQHSFHNINDSSQLRGVEKHKEDELASSLSDYAKQLLSEKSSEWRVSDQQRPVVKKVADTGKVSVSDYEQSWSNYKQCMLDKGYKEIILLNYSNGMHAEAPHVSGTDAQEKQYSNDQDECSFSYVNYVDLLYGMQQGNPSLFADQNEAIVDCLHRTGLVPSSYTAKQFKKESEKGKYSFDESSPSSRSCQVANSSVVADKNTPVEHLW